MTFDEFLDIANLNLVSLCKSYKVPEFVITNKDIFEGEIDSLEIEFETPPTMINTNLIITETPKHVSRYYGDEDDYLISLCTRKNKLKITLCINANAEYDENKVKRISVK